MGHLYPNKVKDFVQNRHRPDTFVIETPTHLKIDSGAGHGSEIISMFTMFDQVMSFNLSVDPNVQIENKKAGVTESTMKLLSWPGTYVNEQRPSDSSFNID